jgi:protein-tyrosine phosphatase
MEFYLAAPDDFTEQLTTIFEFLSGGESPLVIHCTAGKDRTGVATAIVLRALGVQPDVVIDDYALSDRVVDFDALYRTGNLQHSGSWAFLSTLSPEVRAPLMASEPAYIEAMFHRLNRDYGSLEGYLEARLDVDSKTLAQIRGCYLDR